MPTPQNRPYKTRFTNADSTIVVGTDVPTGTEVVYIHWAALVADGTNACSLEIEQPVTTVVAALRSAGTTSQFQAYDPPLRFDVLTTTTTVITFDVAGTGARYCVCWSWQ